MRSPDSSVTDVLIVSHFEIPVSAYVIRRSKISLNLIPYKVLKLLIRFMLIKTGSLSGTCTAFCKGDCAKCYEYFALE